MSRASTLMVPRGTSRSVASPKASARSDATDLGGKAVIQDEDCIGRLWIDKHGTLLLSNAAGLAECHYADLIALSADGTLQATNPCLGRLLESGLQGIGGDGSGIATMQWVAKEDGGRVLVTLAPVLEGPSRRMASLHMAIARLGTPPRLSGRTLMNLFEMTSTEAALAIRLLEGMSVADIAEERGVAESTVRTQLRAVFRKTDTMRQAELVALLRHITTV